MVTSEQPGDPNEPLGIRDVLAQMNRRIDDVNARIDDLREDVNARFDDLRAEVNARFRLLTWGIAIGFAAVLAILGALLARVG